MMFFSGLVGDKSAQQTDPTSDLHALRVLLLGVLEYNVREVGPRHQALNVVG